MSAMGLMLCRLCGFLMGLGGLAKQLGLDQSAMSTSWIGLCVILSHC